VNNIPTPFHAKTCRKTPENCPLCAIYGIIETEVRDWLEREKIGILGENLNVQADFYAGEGLRGVLTGLQMVITLIHTREDEGR